MSSEYLLKVMDGFSYSEAFRKMEVRRYELVSCKVFILSSIFFLLTILFSEASFFADKVMLNSGSMGEDNSASIGKSVI